MNTTITVEGMSCEHCVAHVTQALQDVTGVTEANVSLADGKAEVVFEEPATRSQLLQAIEAVGYNAE